MRELDNTRICILNMEKFLGDMSFSIMAMPQMHSGLRQFF
jgi:hypothetical protein